MKILFLSLGQKLSGPNTWKNGLIEELRLGGNEVLEIDTTNISSVSKISSLGRYEVIHSYHISPSTMIYMLLGTFWQKKIIFTVHGNIFAEDKSKHGLRKLFWLPFHNLVFKLSDKISVPSQFLKNILVMRKPELSKKVEVIYNGIKITTANIRECNKPNRLISVTNFTHYDKARGVILTIEAQKALKKIDNNISLQIVGDGQYLARFKSKFESPETIFLGQRTDVGNLIENSDIFVHSSFLDNLPYVILEAMARSLPIVAVKVGAISEILSEEDLAEPESESLAGKLYLLMTNPTHYRNASERSLIGAKKFSWEKQAKEFVELYSK
jgi:glycosyltransferase involved in cell wall biosynthesis